MLSSLLQRYVGPTLSKARLTSARPLMSSTLVTRDVRTYKTITSYLPLGWITREEKMAGMDNTPPYQPVRNAHPLRYWERTFPASELGVINPKVVALCQQFHECIFEVEQPGQVGKRFVIWSPPFKKLWWIRRPQTKEQILDCLKSTWPIEPGSPLWHHNPAAKTTIEIEAIIAPFTVEYLVHSSYKSPTYKKLSSTLPVGWQTREENEEELQDETTGEGVSGALYWEKRFEARKFRLLDPKVLAISGAQAVCILEAEHEEGGDIGFWFWDTFHERVWKFRGATGREEVLARLQRHHGMWEGDQICLENWGLVEVWPRDEQNACGNNLDKLLKWMANEREKREKSSESH